MGITIDDAIAQLEEIRDNSHGGLPLFAILSGTPYQAISGFEGIGPGNGAVVAIDAEDDLLADIRVGLPEDRPAAGFFLENDVVSVDGDSIPGLCGTAEGRIDVILGGGAYVVHVEISGTMHAQTLLGRHLTFVSSDRVWRLTLEEEAGLLFVPNRESNPRDFAEFISPTSGAVFRITIKPGTYDLRRVPNPSFHLAPWLILKDPAGVEGLTPDAVVGMGHNAILELTGLNGTVEEVESGDSR